MRWWVLLVLAGCYAPTAPAGAPCADGRMCPGDLVCETVGGVDLCVAPGTLGVDAAIDGPVSPDAPVDRDGDGVLDRDDLCPEVFDDQHDEDGDLMGDACDPCPISNQGNADSDGDGLPDDCDVFPNDSGDRLVLFHGFGSAPEGWSIGSAWTFSNDTANYSELNSIGQFVTAPMAISGSTILWAQLALTQLSPGGGVGVGLGSTLAGISCGFSLAPAGLQLVLFDLDNFMELAATPLGAFVPGQRWAVLLARSPDNRYVCLASNSMETFTTKPVMALQPAAVQPFVVAMTAAVQFEFLMVTTSTMQ